MLKFMQKIRYYSRFTATKITRDTSKSQTQSIEHVTKLKPQLTLINNHTIIDLSEGSPEYCKSKGLSTELKHVMSSIKSRKERDKRQRVLLEGKRLIRDAMDSGCTPETILFSRVEDLRSLALPVLDGVKIFKVPYKTLALWSDTVTSQGVLGIFKTPAVESRRPSRDALPLTVICDNVREPGNLGAILRVTAGVGCQRLILTKGCVDLWEPKVLRAAAGAHFRLPIHRGASFSDMAALLPRDAHVFLCDNNAGDQARSYVDVDFTRSSPLVVVVGGETEGLSADALALAAATEGAHLRIPLGNQVESLNSGTALAVVLFEMRRQLTRRRGFTDEGVSLAAAEATR